MSKVHFTHEVESGVCKKCDAKEVHKGWESLYLPCLADDEESLLHFYEGKYSVAILHENKGLRFYRHGQPWEVMNQDLQYSNLILIMAKEILDRRVEVPEATPEGINEPDFDSYRVVPKGDFTKL